MDKEKLSKFLAAVEEGSRDFCEAMSWLGALEEELEKAEQDRDSWERIAIGYYEDHNACPEGWCDCTKCNFTALMMPNKEGE